MTKYLDDSYYTSIYGIDNACVIFTDGTNQFPAAFQDGIAVNSGQELIFQDGKYTVNDHNWIQADQPTNYCVQGETYTCKFIMDEGSHFDLYFRDRATGEFIRPTGEKPLSRITIRLPASTALTSLRLERKIWTFYITITLVTALPGLRLTSGCSTHSIPRQTPACFIPTSTTLRWERTTY